MTTDPNPPFTVSLEGLADMAVQGIDLAGIPGRIQEALEGPVKAINDRLQYLTDALAESETKRIDLAAQLAAAVAAAAEAAATSAAEAAAAKAAYDDLYARYQKILPYAPKERVVWTLDPKKMPLGPVTVATWKAQTGVTQQQSQLAHLSVVDHPRDGRVLRVLLPKDDCDGIALVVPFPGGFTATDATLTSTFVHRNPWPLAPLGGKHAGLGASIPGVGAGAAGGGNYQYDKAAGCRPMWRENNKAITYSYGPKQTLRPPDAGGKTAQGVCYGDGMWVANQAPVYVADKVHTETLRCILNGVNADGSPANDGHTIYGLDGKQLIDHPWLWRTRSDCVLRGVQFAWFAGGDGPKWSWPEDRYIDVLFCQVTVPA